MPSSAPTFWSQQLLSVERVHICPFTLVHWTFSFPACALTPHSTCQSRRQSMRAACHQRYLLLLLIDGDLAYSAEPKEGEDSSTCRTLDRRKGPGFWPIRSLTWTSLLNLNCAALTNPARSLLPQGIPNHIKRGHHNMVVTLDRLKQLWQYRFFFSPKWFISHEIQQSFTNIVSTCGHLEL